jgi:hypothetical protein
MKIGILSFAHHHAEAYIHNLRLLPGVELVGVAMKTPAWPTLCRCICRRFSSYEADQAKPDGVIICTENGKHRRWSRWRHRVASTCVRKPSPPRSDARPGWKPAKKAGCCS